MQALFWDGQHLRLDTAYPTPPAAEIPGGRVEQGATSVTLRTRGRVQSVPAFGEIVVKQQEGHPVLLRDVATIEDGMADAETKANVNGESAVLLTVRRQSGTKRQFQPAGHTNGVEENLVMTDNKQSAIIGT